LSESAWNNFLWYWLSFNYHRWKRFLTRKVLTISNSAGIIISTKRVFVNVSFSARDDPDFDWNMVNEIGPHWAKHLSPKNGSNARMVTNLKYMAGNALASIRSTSKPFQTEVCHPRKADRALLTIFWLTSTPVKTILWSDESNKSMDLRSRTWGDVIDSSVDWLTMLRADAQANDTL
jgi:hypothetical protein